MGQVQTNALNYFGCRFVPITDGSNDSNISIDELVSSFSGSVKLT